MDETKNGQAWELIFKEYDILNEICKNGSFIIKAQQIKKFREPRLMCKFDHESHLPKIFKDNNLSILPISRSEYIIGTFRIFEDVNYSEREPIFMSLPHEIETIDVNSIYSESEALHCAYISGMLEDIAGEPLKQTISGRMGSQEFSFNIDTFEDEKNIEVDSSQIEIDGGYEGESKLLLIEAKNGKVTDFLVRQLYYPYKTWKNKIKKEIIPIFFTYSNDEFDFFIYKFSNDEKYNSLKLIEQKKYMISSTIDLQNVDMYLNPEIMKEQKVPFPQADDITKVFDICVLLMETNLVKENVYLYFDFDPRQADYYINAAKYLGLVHDIDGGEITITILGEKIFQKSSEERKLLIANQILKHKVFKDLYEIYKINYSINKKEIVSTMKSCGLYKIKSDETYNRRASTISSWIKWIYNLECELKNL